jgi:hypothetical protein
LTETAHNHFSTKKMFSRAPTALELYKLLMFHVSCIDVWGKGEEGTGQGDGFGGVKVLNP